MKIKILIADDHSILREGLKNLFEGQTDITVEDGAADGREAVRKAKVLQPNLILMDINMPHLNGMEATRIIKKHWPNIRIIALSVYYERQFISGMLKAGASGYLIKTSTFSEILGAVKQVMRGGFALDRHARNVIFKDYRRLLSEKNPGLESLSEQQKKIMNACIAGTSLKSVAGKLKLEPKETIQLYSDMVRNWLSMV